VVGVVVVGVAGHGQVFETAATGSLGEGVEVLYPGCSGRDHVFLFFLCVPHIQRGMAVVGVRSVAR